MTGTPSKCELNPEQPVRAIIFDLVGTCLDWYSAVTPSFRKGFSLLEGEKPPFELFSWRQRAHWDGIRDCYEAGFPQEDVDETRRRALLSLLESQGGSMGEDAVEACVKAWHEQIAWPDVAAALPLLRSKFDVIVLANGTTRNQLRMTASSGLQFDKLFSSELLGLAKPDPAMYRKVMELLKCKPEECLMVAAHHDDLITAKEVGMRTAYIQRWTEDFLSAEDGTWGEAHERYRDDNDIFIDGRVASGESGGFLELAKMLWTEYDVQL